MKGKSESVFSRRRKRQATEFTMTPLIDCVFLLLIFFMIATSFAPLPGIRVKLPPAGQIQSQQKKEQLIVKIEDVDSSGIGVIWLTAGNNPDGTPNIIPLRNRETQMEALHRILQETTLEKEQLKSLLIIQADGDVIHDQVVNVIDRAKLAGVQTIAFAKK